MLAKVEARRRLYEGAIKPEPLKLTAVLDGKTVDGGRADFIIELDWKGTRRRFIATYAAVATPRKLDAAIREAKSLASEHPDNHPMVLVPYISEATATRLREEEISGLDFSGNIAIVIPGEWLVLQTGQPNKYPSNQPIKNVYEGKSALVGRVLLRKPHFSMVKGVRAEILHRGGSISMGTVSKVLSTLEEDLIVQKQSGIRLIQPESLLDRLAQNYRAPNVKRRIVGKIMSDESFPDALLKVTADSNVRLVGRSEGMYVLSPRDTEMTTVYVSRLGDWIGAVPFQEADRFATVEFAEVDDESVFFDGEARDGFPWCSRLQIYMELMQGGKRERDAAAQLRPDILPFRED